MTTLHQSLAHGLLELVYLATQGAYLQDQGLGVLPHEAQGLFSGLLCIGLCQCLVVLDVLVNEPTATAGNCQGQMPSHAPFCAGSSLI